VPVRIEPFHEGALRLRCYERGDLDRLTSLLTDPITMGPVGGPIRRDEILGLLERYLAEDDARYLVVLAAFDGETYVASGRVFVSDLEPDVPEIGYLVRSPYWRRGYGTHVARALTRVARAHLGASRVIARTSFTNVGSARVLENAGFTRERATETDLIYACAVKP
jgi:RimJ/RimL family protein N-acetyltransferase